MRYELPDGGFETIPENSGIRRFIWELCLATNQILQRIKAYGGTFNGKKSFIGLQEAVVVRHLCTYTGRIPEADRVQKIMSWPIPTSLMEVRAFLGTCGVVKIFIKDFALIARPLVNLTRKDVPFEFGEEEEESMERLRTAIITSPALRPIDYTSDRPIILAVNSCPIAVGFILSQIGSDGKRYPNCFGSITFNERESRYSQAKLELYGLF
jgi:RNase H-like domain found in reverse transcriptase